MVFVLVLLPLLVGGLKAAHSGIRTTRAGRSIKKRKQRNFVLKFTKKQRDEFTNSDSAGGVRKAFRGACREDGLEGLITKRDYKKLMKTKDADEAREIILWAIEKREHEKAALKAAGR